MNRELDVSTGHLIGLAAAGALIIAAPMPWADVDAGIFSDSVRGTDGDGVITMIAGMALAIILVLNLFWVVPCRLAALSTAVVGGIATWVAATDWADLAALEDTGVAAEITAGFGLGLTLSAGVILLAVAAFGHRHDGPDRSFEDERPLPAPIARKRRKAAAKRDEDRNAP